MKTVDRGGLGVLLKSRGRHMSRAKYQRPEVYLWKGKSGEKFWKAEWRVYIEGRPKPKHRAATWPCAEYTKTAAQAECDKAVREETGGPLIADGSLTVAEFWRKVYWPTASLRIARNTQYGYESSWRRWIKPAIGNVELQHLTKTMIDGIVNKMAIAGRKEGTIDLTRMVAHGMLAEAVENGYIARNPAHRVTTPRAKPGEETRPLTEEEARRILAAPPSRTALMFRILLLTGARISELLSLTQADLRPDGTLLIDESNTNGKPNETKNRKTRIAPLPPKLRVELEAWAAETSKASHLIFPGDRGELASRKSMSTERALTEMRKLSGIHDLTWRQCRTTFATLFRGDPRDIQAILGHSTVDLTMNIYRKPIVERQQAAVKELEARLSGKVVPMKKRESA
jgi:integrase